MYVIGVKESGFLNIESNRMMTWESCTIWNEVKKIIYGYDLSEATLFPDYESATKIVEEIKMRKNEILFENASIIGQILDEQKGNEFDVNELKVYELIPMECKDNHVRIVNMHNLYIS